MTKRENKKYIKNRITLYENADSLEEKGTIEMKMFGFLNSVDEFFLTKSGLDFRKCQTRNYNNCMGMFIKYFNLIF